MGVREKLHPSVLLDAAFMCFCNGRTGGRGGHSGSFFPPVVVQRELYSSLNVPPTHLLHVLTVELESLLLKLR